MPVTLLTFTMHPFRSADKDCKLHHGENRVEIDLEHGAPVGEAGISIVPLAIVPLHLRGHPDRRSGQTVRRRFSCDPRPTQIPAMPAPHPRKTRFSRPPLQLLFLSSRQRDAGPISGHGSRCGAPDAAACAVMSATFPLSMTVPSLE